VAARERGGLGIWGCMSVGPIPGILVGQGSISSRALNGLAYQLALLPPSMLRALARGALRGHGAALCFHRVGAALRAGVMADLWNTAQSIDEIIALLRPGVSGASSRRLVVSFDDGYASAYRYVRDNAARFPDVTFILFVCPAKIERRIGFPWDLPEDLVRGSGSVQREGSTVSGRPDPLTENSRPELAGLADQLGTRLVTVEECRQLLDLPNATLGNHTNAHIAFTATDDAAWVEDMKQSFADFERLFGRCEDFAIPFGAPWVEFTPDHVVRIRETWDGRTWTTEPRSFPRNAMQPGAVLPRFGVLGTRPPGRVAAGVALRSLLSPLRRPIVSTFAKGS